MTKARGRGWLALVLGAAIIATGGKALAADAGGAHTAPKATRAKGPTEADQLQTLPGFKVEMILKADMKLNGSWISMANDNKGRLLLGGQKGQPITRVTLDAD